MPSGRNNAGVGVIAPISGSAAILKSMVTHGVRHCSVKKESTGKIGLRVRGLRVGDSIDLKTRDNLCISMTRSR